MTITRGRHLHPTIEGVRKRSSGGWDVRFDGVPTRSATCGSPRSPPARRTSSASWRSQLETAGSPGTRAGPARPERRSVHPAVLLADSLLDHGSIGRVRTARGETTYQADSDALFRGWPMAVLVDESTRREPRSGSRPPSRTTTGPILVGTAHASSAIVPSRHCDGVVHNPRRRRFLVDQTAHRPLERGDGRALSETEPPGGSGGFVLTAVDLDELEQVAKRTVEWVARESRKDPNAKAKVRHRKSYVLGQNTRTGVKPDHLVDAIPPAAAGPAQPGSQGPSREP